jgi:hypothetical protein
MAQILAVLGGSNGFELSSSKETFFAVFRPFVGGTCGCFLVVFILACLKLVSPVRFGLVGLFWIGLAGG